MSLLYYLRIGLVALTQLSDFSMNFIFESIGLNKLVDLGLIACEGILSNLSNAC